MREKGKRSMGFTVLLVLVLILYLAVLELSKNTVLGWVLALIVFCGYYLLHRNILVDKAWWVRLFGWIGFFVICFVIFKISFPPYKQVPAVNVKNPQVTDVKHVE